MKTKSTSEENQNIDEEFVLEDIKSIDSKHRINIGIRIMHMLSKITGSIDSFQVFIGSKGDVLLRPTVNIPSKEGRDAILKIHTKKICFFRMKDNKLSI